MSTVTLYQGDCREILPTLPSASVDCCIADLSACGRYRYRLERSVQLAGVAL